MHKVVSCPYFSSELDHLFPTLSLLILCFLITSSSLGSKTWFNVHSGVQIINSIQILSRFHGVWQERMFSMYCSRPCNSLDSFYPAFSWPWSCLHLTHTSSQGGHSPSQDPAILEDVSMGCLTQSLLASSLSQPLYFELLVCSWFKRFR